MRLLKSVSENFVGIEDSEGRKVQGMVGSRSHAEPSLTPSPQESESVSDEAPSDPLLLAILVHLLCCPLGNAALPCSSQVGMCVMSVLTLRSLSMLALTLNQSQPCLHPVGSDPTLSPCRAFNPSKNPFKPICSCSVSPPKLRQGATTVGMNEPWQSRPPTKSSVSLSQQLFWDASSYSSP